jgi:hypothetical protein
MSHDSTEQAAHFILRIIEEEGQRLGIDPKIERTEKRSRTNEMVVSLKGHGRTFRITFGWVRDDFVANHGFHLGNGYIETDWTVRLRPQRPQFPVVGPFQWELHSRDKSISRASHPHTLEESWLRQLIRKKLAIEHDA